MHFPARRREFLELGGLALGAAVAAGCAPAVDFVQSIGASEETRKQWVLSGEFPNMDLEQRLKIIEKFTKTAYKAHYSSKIDKLSDPEVEYLSGHNFELRTPPILTDLGLDEDSITPQNPKWIPMLFSARDNKILVNKESLFWEDKASLGLARNSPRVNRLFALMLLKNLNDAQAPFVEENQEKPIIGATDVNVHVNSYLGLKLITHSVNHPKNQMLDGFAQGVGILAAEEVAKEMGLQNDLIEPKDRVVAGMVRLIGKSLGISSDDFFRYSTGRGGEGFDNFLKEIGAKNSKLKSEEEQKSWAYQFWAWPTVYYLNLRTEYETNDAIKSNLELANITPAPTNYLPNAPRLEVKAPSAGATSRFAEYMSTRFKPSGEIFPTAAI